MHRKVPWRRSTGLEIASLASFKTFHSGKYENKKTNAAASKTIGPISFSLSCVKTAARFIFIDTPPTLHFQQIGLHNRNCEPTVHATSWPWFFTSNTPTQWCSCSRTWPFIFAIHIRISSSLQDFASAWVSILELQHSRNAFRSPFHFPVLPKLKQ